MKFVGMGDNVVDRYINKKIMFPGGNAVNFAVYAAKCGAEAAYLGVFADDPEGKLIRRALREERVDLSACTVLNEAATEKCDVVLIDGDRNFVGSGWEEGKEHFNLRLGESELTYLQGFDVIHCGCYADMEEEMQKLAGFSALRTFDFSSEEEYRTQNYLEKICPYIDVALFSAQDMQEGELHELQKRVKKLGTQYVLTTNGTKGQIFYDGEKEHHGIVKKITPVDTMGAGDAFFTAFVTELYRNGLRQKKSVTEEAIRSAFDYAAHFSANQCLVEGSFGYAETL